MTIFYPKAGDLLVPAANAPAEVQDKLLLIFFANPSQGVMAWDIANIDEDILFPVLVRKYRLEVLTGNIPDINRDLLNGGPSTLQPGRERDFFVVYDAPVGNDAGTERISSEFAYAPLTQNQNHVRLLEDLRLTRLLIIRGFMGFDKDPFQEQLDAHWWRVIPGDADLVFGLAPDARLPAAQARARVN